MSLGTLQPCSAPPKPQSSEPPKSLCRTADDLWQYLKDPKAMGIYGILHIMGSAGFISSTV